MLGKKQICLLRLHFGFNPAGFARPIDVAAKYEIAKIESETFPGALTTVRRIRLKFFRAKLLKIRDADIIL